MNPFVVLKNIWWWFSVKSLWVYDKTSWIPLFDYAIPGFFWKATGWFFDAGLSCLDLASWYQRVSDRISTWLTSLDVLNIMSSFITKVNQLWVWLGSWWANVQAAISTWWAGTRTTVLSWVQTAKDYAASLYTTLQQSITSLNVKWDNFWTVTLPSLATRVDVSILITSALAPWVRTFNVVESFGKDIVDFFGDPPGWLASHIEDWFWGKEVK